MNYADMPAMPTPKGLLDDLTHQCVTESLGLTKREMFAMNVMQGILSGNSLQGLSEIAAENGLDDADSLIVGISIKAADSLLKELEK